MGERIQMIYIPTHTYLPNYTEETPIKYTKLPNDNNKPIAPQNTCNKIVSNWKQSKGKNAQRTTQGT